MIIEALVARSRILLPYCNELWLVSDNARTYQNDVTAFIAPFICAAHRFIFRGFLHPETARRKSLVDTHYAIPMRQVHKYLTETIKDVTIPVELIKTLDRDDRICSCPPDLLTVHQIDTFFLFAV